MDLKIEANLLEVAKILKAVGFRDINIKNSKVIEAKMKDGYGRVHVLGVAIDENNTYLDIHRDALLHIAFIGVDYKKKPKEIYEKILRQIVGGRIRTKGIGGTSWFNRKNKAILRGIKLDAHYCWIYFGASSKWK